MGSLGTFLAEAGRKKSSKLQKEGESIKASAIFYSNWDHWERLTSK